MEFIIYHFPTNGSLSAWLEFTGPFTAAVSKISVAQNKPFYLRKGSLGLLINIYVSQGWLHPITGIQNFLLWAQWAASLKGKSIFFLRITIMYVKRVTPAAIWLFKFAQWFRSVHSSNWQAVVEHSATKEPHISFRRWWTGLDLHYPDLTPDATACST